MKAFDDRERGEQLEQVPAWTYDEGRKAIFRQIVTESFVETFGLMTQIAIIAEKLDHHPEWSNVYNRLDIWLTTHDAGGVSQRDIILAREIDRLSR